MIGQLYYVVPDDEAKKNALPAHFVHYNDDDDFVRGFIVSVTEERLTICLFQPTELPDNAIVVQDFVDPDAVYDMLCDAIDINPGMRQHWVEALEGASNEH